MKILTLDLGTTTGIAFGDISTGLTPDISSRKWATDKEIKSFGKNRLDRRQDPRLIRFFQFLQMMRAEKPAIVVFEDVEFSLYRKQTQLWASWRTAVWLAFDPPTIIECVPVATLKKFAGSGSLDKDGMSRALKSQHPELWKPEYDDNAIDAIWLWLWAKKTLGRLDIARRA